MHRTQPALSSFRIDRDGGLALQRSMSCADAPTFLATDRTGKYLLAAYYQGGYAAVHPLGADGAIGDPPLDRHDTAMGAHAIATDPSNRFAFVPHIARLQDNVLEPPKNNPGPNFIAQFRFDAQSGRLTPNTPFRVEQGELVGPRHYCFHPTRDLVYFSDEQGCSVTAYRLDGTAGTLSAVQRVNTLPEGYSERNTCSQIQQNARVDLVIPERGLVLAQAQPAQPSPNVHPCFPDRACASVRTVYSDRGGADCVLPRLGRRFPVFGRHGVRTARFVSREP